MDNIELKDICFDKEDALLFTYNDDLMLKARAIQNSILPKLDALVRKSLNRIEKIYGISVFEEKSHHIYWPHFRENRINDLKTDYENAGSGISASRLKIWTKLNRDDNKDVTIIPVSLYYLFLVQKEAEILWITIKHYIKSVILAKVIRARGISEINT